MLVILSLLAAPLLAQEVEVEPVAVEATNLYMVEDIVVIGVLFIILALLVLLGASIAALWRSAPGWMGDLVKPLVDGVLATAIDYTTKTENTIDDELMKVIREELLGNPAVIAESVLKVDAAVFGTNHSGGDPDLLDPVLADPVPTGG